MIPGGALALALAAAAPCADPVRGGRPPLAEGCLVVYVDVGTNIGVQLRKFFQPEHYPGSKAMPVFASSFPTDESVRRGSRPCAFGFEANPTHTERLRQLEAAYTAAGHRLSIATETAVGTAEGNTTFFFTGSLKNDRSASVAQNAWLRRGHARVLQATVRTIDLARWLRAEVFARSEATRPGAVVVMKLDIEGSEESVLPWLAQCGALCGLGPTMLEKHTRLAIDNATYERAVGPFIRAARTRSLRALAGVMRAAPGERCTFQPLLVDDNSYSADDGSTGNANLDRAFGITQRAPFPEPLPLSADGRAEGAVAPWPYWARAQRDAVAMLARRGRRPEEGLGKKEGNQPNA